MIRPWRYGVLESFYWVVLQRERPAIQCSLSVLSTHNRFSAPNTRTRTPLLLCYSPAVVMVSLLSVCMVRNHCALCFGGAPNCWELFLRLHGLRQITSSPLSSPVTRVVAFKYGTPSFHTIFKHTPLNRSFTGNSGMSFASDDLLICSGYQSNKFYSYNISKSKVTVYPYPDIVGAVISLSSEFVSVSCADDMIRVYKVYDNQLRLLATLPHKRGYSHKICYSLRCYSMCSCLYPYNDAGYVLACSDDPSPNLFINVTSRFNRYWVQEVAKRILNSKILPFCRDVHKIIWQYLS